MKIYDRICDSIGKGKKLFAVLIDPEDIEFASFARLVDQANQAHVDLFLLGGSTVTNDNMNELIAHIKQYSTIPCLIFPGDVSQIDASADALMFLSLISGRNPEYLIGKHVEAAAKLKDMDLEVIPCGYILIESGNLTSVQYVSQTLPIPRERTELAVSTAIAGQLLGMRMIYLEAGSGAKDSVPTEMVREIKKNMDIPLFVGGGLRTEEQIKNVMDAGADIIVIGNAFEKDPDLIYDFSCIIHSFNKKQTT